MFNKLFSNQLSIVLFKWLIVLFLINIFIINPLGKALSKASESIYDNEIAKIVALDFIDNPLTLARLAKLSIEKNKIENARLYLRYSEIIVSRYNYPDSLKKELQQLDEAISKLEKN